MQKELYKKYATIREKLASLEEQEAALKVEILQDMEKSGSEKLDTDYGRFTVCTKKKWTYSKKVTKLAEDLKVQKYIEEEKGIAKVEESHYLAYKAIIEE